MARVNFNGLTAHFFLNSSHETNPTKERVNELVFVNIMTLMFPFMLLQMIVTVFNDGTKTEVPIVPETTVSDIIECCRDPGDEGCDLLCLDCPDIPGECVSITKPCF